MSGSIMPDKSEILRRGKFERLDTSFKINFYIGKDKKNRYSVMCDNISGRGVKFTLEEKIGPGEFLDFEYINAKCSIRVVVRALVSEIVTRD